MTDLTCWDFCFGRLRLAFGINREIGLDANRSKRIVTSIDRYEY